MVTLAPSARRPTRDGGPTTIGDEHLEQRQILYRLTTEHGLRRRHRRQRRSLVLSCYPVFDSDGFPSHVNTVSGHFGYTPTQILTVLA